MGEAPDGAALQGVTTACVCTTRTRETPMTSQRKEKKIKLKRLIRYIFLMCVGFDKSEEHPGASGEERRPYLEWEERFLTFS